MPLHHDIYESTHSEKKLFLHSFLGFSLSVSRLIRSSVYFVLVFHFRFPFAHIRSAFGFEFMIIPASSDLGRANENQEKRENIHS